MAHDSKMAALCKSWFCGNNDFTTRISDGGDDQLRAIAFEMGTAPQSYKIPTLPEYLAPKS